MPELVLLDVRYKESFLQALHEYHGEKLATYELLDETWLVVHFAEYIAQLQQEALGQRLPPGYVPHTVFWLVEGDQYLGRVDIRHQLNEWLQTIGGHIGYDIRPSVRGKGYGKLILRLGLLKAAELGLNEVLVTCDVTNLPSNNVIQGNGGTLIDRFPVGTGLPDKNRYRISTPSLVKKVAE